MVHLAFDTNIWFDFIREAREEPLNAIEFWISHGHAKILLSETVSIEWHRGIKSVLETKIKEHNRLLSNNELHIPENVKWSETVAGLTQNLEQRRDRIEKLFENYSVKLAVHDGLRLQAAKLAEQGLPPFESKNNMNDALILLSVLEYVRSTAISKCFFITKNRKDFSDKDDRSKIHSNFQTEFDELGINYFIDLHEFIHKSNDNGLPDFKEHFRRISEEMEVEIKSLQSPYDTYSTLSELGDSYLSNINHLDLILKSASPTKQEASFAIGLIKSGEQYESYFFKKIDSGIWFNILKEAGFFDCKNNLAPIVTEGGMQSPVWYPLVYLEKLSKLIKEGKEQKLIRPILEIIKSVCEHPVQNHLSNISIIRILSNIPNSEIPASLLNFIPSWLNSRYSNTLESHTLCRNLLPKFLIDEPTAEDVIKAEIILTHLLNITLAAPGDFRENNSNNSSYVSRIYLPELHEALISKKLISKVARFCTTNVLALLIENNKKLALDYPNGIEVLLETDPDNDRLTVFIEQKNLRLVIQTVDKELKYQSVIYNYEEYDKADLKNKLTSSLKSLGYQIAADGHNDRQLERILFYLRSDLLITGMQPAVSKLKFESYHRTSIQRIFPLLLREFVNERIKSHPLTAVSICKDFLLRKDQKVRFFKKLFFFAVAENWANEGLRKFFWETVSNDDFSNEEYEDDLRFLLKKNVDGLSETESNMLLQIIEKGPQGKISITDEQCERWKLYWILPLANHPLFKSLYERLSEKDYTGIRPLEDEDEESSILRPGSISPMTMEQILEMPTFELAKALRDFKPKDRWEKPNVSGFAEALGKAVAELPEKFASEMELFKLLPYTYMYRVLRGFEDGWSKRKGFNWQNVLDFLLDYISSDEFAADKLVIENDDWAIGRDQITSSVARLISTGMHNDENSFDSELIPLVKRIIIKMSEWIVPVSDFPQTNLDYPTYSVNSLAGQVLRALLDYSLKKARLEQREGAVVWENDMKLLFETTLRNRVIDGYILEGMYFRQFYFLDEEWTKRQIMQNIHLPDDLWNAFSGGLNSTNANFNREMYDLLCPHYARAIAKGIDVKNFYSNGLIHHLVAFYFWRFDRIHDDRLVKKFLTTGSDEAIHEFVRFIGHQKRYSQELDEVEKSEFVASILILWEYLSEKYGASDTKAGKDIMGGLLSWLVFIPKLDATFVALVLKSISHVQELYFIDDLINELIEIKNKDNTKDAADHIAKILIAIKFNRHFVAYQDENLLQLIEFLYENEQKTVADKICNYIGETGNDFSKELYNRYNKLLD